MTPIDAFHPHLLARCPATHTVLGGSLGVFEVQRGFDGSVGADFVDCRRMLPSVLVWTRDV